MYFRSTKICKSLSHCVYIDVLHSDPSILKVGLKEKRCDFFCIAIAILRFNPLKLNNLFCRNTEVSCPVSLHVQLSVCPKDTFANTLYMYFSHLCTFPKSCTDAYNVSHWINDLILKCKCVLHWMQTVFQDP